MRPFRQSFIASLFVSMVALLEPATADDVSDCFTGDSAKLESAGYWDSGIQACTRLVAIRSGNALASTYASRASWKTKKKQYDEAMVDYDRALALSTTASTKVQIYDFIADVWLAREDFDRAIATYDRSIRLDPTYAPAYFSRGMAFEKQGKLDAARRSYHSALAAPKTLAGDTTGLQSWAQRNAATRLEEMDKKKSDR